MKKRTCGIGAATPSSATCWLMVKSVSVLSLRCLLDIIHDPEHPFTLKSLLEDYTNIDACCRLTSVANSIRFSVTGTIKSVSWISYDH